MMKSNITLLQLKTEIRYFYLNKVILCYLFGEYHQAAKTAVLARQYVEEVQAITVVTLLRFYHSLVLLSLLVEASSSEKEAWLSCVSITKKRCKMGRSRSNELST